MIGADLTQFEADVRFVFIAYDHDFIDRTVSLGY